MVRWSDSDISIQFPDVGQVVYGDLFTGNARGLPHVRHDGSDRSVSRGVLFANRSVSQDLAVGGWECDARHGTPHFGIENMIEYVKIYRRPIKGCDNPGHKFRVSVWAPSKEPLDVKKCHMGTKYFHKPQLSTSCQLVIS